jgi:tRNA-splicing ligase RtcB (3'-phosphate/5'-hydroxy nucleic acid ligase)
MVQRSDFNQLNDTLWELPSSFRQDMQVPARVFADNRMINAIFEDKTADQLVNMTTLPGAVGWAAAMPDAHQGYGFCIGGVLATELPDGIISPGGVGYDINCGVRLLRSQLHQEEITPHVSDLMSAINRNCPSGVGTSGPLRLRDSELNRLLAEGAKWALEQGYARREDLEHTESSGRIPGADPDCVSKRAKQRGVSQVGTLGAGNHFIEVDVVDEICDQKVADVMGLSPGLVMVQIHTGSRGLGHQVASDYVKEFQTAVHRYNIKLPDRELVCAPLNSPEGQSYFGAMCAAANYAFNNRQLLTHWVRQSFEQVLAPYTRDFDLFQIYDIAHNIAKVESHSVRGRTRQVCVHRKGATRAFGPGFEELPAQYRSIGQPVLVPGSMGTASWILTGAEKSMRESFGSCCHGAGRTMSRSQAKKTVWGGKLRDELEAAGIVVRAGSMAGLAEEAPLAYKDVDMVVDIVHRAGLASRVARLRPVGVMKG